MLCQSIDQLRMNGHMNDCEFVCSYILLYLQETAESSQTTLCGKRKEPLDPKPNGKFLLKDIPGILKYELCPLIKVVDIYRLYYLKGIKESTQKSLLEWSINNRPYQLRYF